MSSKNPFAGIDTLERRKAAADSAVSAALGLADSIAKRHFTEPSNEVVAKIAELFLSEMSNYAICERLDSIADNLVEPH